MTSSAKHHRWIDLLATLLAHRYPMPFEAIARGVPSYLADGSVEAGHPSDAVKRMFERDKKELREFGVPIETVGQDGTPDAAYRLTPDEFYLPYLTIATPRGPSPRGPSPRGPSPRGQASPRTVDRYGYRALKHLTFEPDELAVIADAARRALTLGDPALRSDVESAMRKLAFDLPIDLDTAPSNVRHLAARPRIAPGLLESLGDALVRRKRATFDYLSMDDGTTSHRTVEPYGLFFLNAHWYLVARDVDKDALRNFRVSRIRDARVNASRAGTPDYTIPTTFHLRDHARSRPAWELGDGDAIDTIVEFTTETGAAVAGAKLGAPVPDAPRQRQFRVRRTDAFVRWVLAFAGDAWPVSPAGVVAAFDAIVRKTRAMYPTDGR